MNDVKQHFKLDGDLKRCPKCQLHQPLCLCQELPSIEVQTKIILILHKREFAKPSNTGRLAHLCLPNSELWVRGNENSHVNPDLSNFNPLCLFPSQNAVNLESRHRSLSVPVALVVPDGNWSQAARIPKREPFLRGVQCVKLDQPPPSRYRLRRDPSKAYGLATLESIAHALAILEGPEVAAQLFRVFDLFVHRSLWARGKIREDPMHL